ncbi:MAG: hypothetical protein HKM95_09840 [Inquilinus sp.]|nr:hypothetical protein [Inquilinus sp.]
MRVDGRIATAGLMLAIFAAMTGIALGFPPKARLMPLMVGVPATLLALIHLGLEIRDAIRRETPTPEQAAKEAGRFRAERRMVFWIALFFAGVMGFGFFWGAPPLVFAFLYWGERERLAVALVGGAGTWAVLYGVFARALELFLFEGFVVRALSG